MKPTLVIMAAGLGSRFGGLKQLSPVGPSGEYIMDYSVYDALAAGFGKIVFVIKREMEQDFRSALSGNLERVADVHYAFQELTDVPKGCSLPPERIKPWGTGHAVLSARNVVHEPFAAINADDFYGANSFAALHGFLTSQTVRSYKRSQYAMVGFALSNTLSDSGSVSRGVCVCDAGGNLIEVNERTHIERKEDAQTYYTENGQDIPLDEGTVVSMNMWGFEPDIFERIQAKFEDFFKVNSERITTAEFYLPAAVDAMIKDGSADVSVLNTDERWLGLTNPGDKDAVSAAIAKMAESGKYPRSLWGSYSSAN